MKYIIILSLVFIAGCSGGGGGSATAQKVLSIPSAYQSIVATYSSTSDFYGFGEVDNLIIQYSTDSTLNYETLAGRRGLCVLGSNPRIILYQYEWDGITLTSADEGALYHLMGHCHRAKVHNAGTSAYWNGPNTLMADGWNQWMYTKPGNAQFDSNDLTSLVNNYWLYPN